MLATRQCALVVALAPDCVPGVFTCGAPSADAKLLVARASRPLSLLGERRAESKKWTVANLAAAAAG